KGRARITGIGFFGRVNPRGAPENGSGVQLHPAVKIEWLSGEKTPPRRPPGRKEHGRPPGGAGGASRGTATKYRVAPATATRLHRRRPTGTTGATAASGRRPGRSRAG